MSIAKARVEPGITTCWHSLDATTERYLILSGKGVVEIGDLSATEVGPGDAVLIPPGTSQRISNQGESDLVFLAICTPRFQANCYQTESG